MLTEDFRSEQAEPISPITPTTMPGNMQARISLVQLMLPFAVESKRLANINGLLPWELAPDIKVA